MKKLISFLCSLVFCISAVPMAHAVSYTDVDAATAEGKAISKMTECGILEGYPNGTFLPQASLSRAEFTKIINKTFGFQLMDEAIPMFSDIQATHWAYQEIKIAQKANYIQGVGNNQFAPDQKLTRQEVCVILDRIQNYQNFLGTKVVIQDTVADWARASVEKAIVCGLFANPTNGLFRATQPITRGEMCEAVAQYVQGSKPDVPVTPPKPQTPVVPLPSDNTHTAEERAKEAEVAAYLADIVSEYQKANLDNYCDDAFVKHTVRLLMDCMPVALEGRKQGTFLTRHYLDTNFPSEIQAFSRDYHSMTSEQVALAKGLMSRFATLYAIEAVTEYFGINQS